MAKPKFVVWRRAFDEVHCLGNLEEKVEEAKEMIEEEGYNEVIILEVRKIVKRDKLPIVVVNP